MSTETVNLTINATEVRSISEVASIIANAIQDFADRWGVGGQYDRERMEQDMIMFLVKRNSLNLTRLECHVMEDGTVSTGYVSGRRKADLFINLRYVGGRGYL